MLNSASQSGRHRKITPPCSATVKRNLLMTAGALTITGGIQVVAASASSAAVSPLGGFTAPAADGNLYYTLDNVPAYLKSGFEAAVKNWNRELGYELIRPVPAGQAAQITVREDEAGVTPGGSADAQTANGLIRFRPSLMLQGSPGQETWVTHVAAHELGHILGLGHTPGTASCSDLMFGAGTAGNANSNGTACPNSVNGDVTAPTTEELNLASKNYQKLAGIASRPKKPGTQQRQGNTQSNTTQSTTCTTQQPTRHTQSNTTQTPQDNTTQTNQWRLDENGQWYGHWEQNGYSGDWRWDGQQWQGGWIPQSTNTSSNTGSYSQPAQRTATQAGQQVTSWNQPISQQTYSAY